LVTTHPLYYILLGTAYLRELLQEPKPTWVHFVEKAQEVAPCQPMSTRRQIRRQFVANLSSNWVQIVFILRTNCRQVMAELARGRSIKEAWIHHIFFFRKSIIRTRTRKTNDKWRLLQDPFLHDNFCSIKELIVIINHASQNIHTVYHACRGYK